MLYRLLECIIYILAAYGLLVLILGAADLLCCRIRGKRPKVRVVLLVKDAEDQIEYIIRNAVRKDYSSKSMSDKKLAVVDVDSADNTYELLEKLKSNFTSIEVFKFEDREQLYNDFDIFSPP